MKTSNWLILLILLALPIINVIVSIVWLVQSESKATYITRKHFVAAYLISYIVCVCLATLLVVVAGVSLPILSEMHNL